MATEVTAPVQSSIIEEVVVYLPSAKALTFRHVVILVDDVNLLVLDYVSKRDASRRTAKFYTSRIVGWSQTHARQFGTLR